MRLAKPIPLTTPPAWPAALGWSDGLGAILNPDEPLTAVVHPDRFSSQRNEDEAKLVASLVGLLRSRLLPLGPGTSAPFNDVDLFKEGVGVVTPHRAQQAAVIDQIEQNFRLSPEATAAMYDAIDTVERFQGQQKVEPRERQGYAPAKVAIDEMLQQPRLTQGGSGWYAPAAAG